MRRKDREVNNQIKIKEIIESCYCCRLGLNDQGSVYIVPLNFGYIEKEGKYTFYFHSAKMGRKIDILKDNPYVGFELDTHYQLHEADSACDFSAAFQSVIGSGKISFIENNEEKKMALNTIMEHYTHQHYEFLENRLKSVCVFQLEVNELSCKEHL